MLVLEVEWLTDVCVATPSPAAGFAEWPVQPDRIFSALVATWGAHGEPEHERRALEWLEELEPPRLKADHVGTTDPLESGMVMLSAMVLLG